MEERPPNYFERLFLGYSLISSKEGEEATNGLNSIFRAELLIPGFALQREVSHT
jgi:hypothetical protein